MQTLFLRRENKNREKSESLGLSGESLEPPDKMGRVAGIIPCYYYMYKQFMYFI